MKNAPVVISPLQAFARKVANKLKRKPEYFLSKVRGVIHVGANYGQERDIYAKHDLNVLWIEPNPELFQELSARIAEIPKQKALCHLVTDVDDKEYTFHIGSNKGESSSIFEFGGHKELWPEVSFTQDIILKSVTLSALVQKGIIQLLNYDALVMDTQGSELLILKGAEELLPAFKFIKTEVADFHAYQNCCLLSDLDGFLEQHAFRRVVTNRFAHKPGLGSYFDVTYKNLRKKP
jgi:FkbM family methyltransferase